MVLEGLEHGTARFVGVGAVREAAVLGEMEDLLEIAGNLLGLHVEGAEALDAWSVDDIRGKRRVESGRRSVQRGRRKVERGKRIVKRYHFGEGGGVHAHVMGIGELGGAEVDAWHETVDEGGLPHPTIAAEYGDLVFKQRTEVVDALSRLSGDLPTLVADGLVEVDHRLLITSFILVEQVGLIEDEHYWHVVGLGRRQEAVDERGAGLRVGHSDHQEGLIYIGRNDMALLGEVDALADDVVAAILDRRDKAPIKLYPVAHGHRVSRANALQSEISLYLTIKQLAIVCLDGVPTACVFYDKTFQLIES